MRTFIGLTGVKGSGKTTAFTLLSEILSDVKEVTLARKLKQVSSMVFNVPMDHFDNQALKEVPFKNAKILTADKINSILKIYFGETKGDRFVKAHATAGTRLESPRRIAQFLGTEVLRSVDSDVHCNYAIKNLPDSGIFIVTDMRFQTEFDFFNRLEGVTFKPLYIANERAEEAGAGDMHPSERQVLEVAKNCQRVDNNGSIEELTRNLQEVFVL